MRKFTKGKLTTLVEDNDRRIPSYLAAGWEEEDFGVEATPTKAEELIKKAKDDANASEPKKEGNGKKNNASDEKINDAIKANAKAAEESREIDDGLIIKKTETEKEADDE